MVPPMHKLLATDTAIYIEQHDPPRSPKEVLPTMYDLPSEDPEEPGLPDEFHDLQPQLLSRTLSLMGYSRENCFTASDLNLYYNVRHPLWHKHPDWFLVLDVPRLYEQRDLRRSYVLWQEGNPPTVVVEFLSPGTEAEDLGRFYDETSEDSERESTNPAASTVVSSGDNQATQAKPPANSRCMKPSCEFHITLFTAALPNAYAISSWRVDSIRNNHSIQKHRWCG